MEGLVGLFEACVEAVAEQASGYLLPFFGVWDWGVLDDASEEGGELRGHYLVSAFGECESTDIVGVGMVEQVSQTHVVYLVIDPHY